MESIEFTSVSSKGQVVIPRKIRERMKLQEGEKLIVVEDEDNDTIILKKVGLRSFKGFDKLLKKTQKHAKKHRFTEKDMFEAIERARRKK